MELFQEISFSGRFEKAEEEDESAVIIENGKLKFYVTGQVHLAVDTAISESIRTKWMLEKVGIDDDEPYKAHYKISGQDENGLQIKAIVMKDTTFAPAFSLLQIMLCKTEAETPPLTTAVEYGLVSSKPISQPSTPFPKANAKFFITPQERIEAPDNISLSLSSTLKIEPLLNVVDEFSASTMPNFEYCCGVIQFMLLFCRGDLIDSIYKKDYALGVEKPTKEFWPGKIKAAPKRSGLEAIQKGEQVGFLNEVFGHLSFETVEKYGLFPAMYWYAESFGDLVINTEIALLFICLETLADSYSEVEDSRRLVAKTTRKDIVKKIDALLKAKKEEISTPEISIEDLEKYDVFSGKIMSIFQDGQLNRFTSLGGKLKMMLKELNIEHSDLFPDIPALVGLRNDVVHRGSTQNQKGWEARLKLSNLVIRVILTILGYEGTYREWNDSGDLQYKSLKIRVKAPQP